MGSGSPCPGTPRPVRPLAAQESAVNRTRALVVLAASVALLAGCAQGADPATPGTRAAPPSTTTTTPTTPVTPSTPATGKTPAGTLLVADFGADTVTFVDPARGPIGSVRVGTAPYGFVVGADGRAWVATAEGVAVVDTASRTRVALVPYRTATGPVTTGEYRGGGMGIALSPDGRRAYVGVNVPGGNGTLEVIDTASLKVTDRVSVGRRPFDVDVSRDGAEVYATDHDSFDVTVVRADTLRTRRIEVAPYGTAGGLGSWLKPHYAVVRPSDGKLLLPFEGERLVELDPRTGRSEIRRMTADTHQHGATITPDGTLFVVGTGPIDPATDEGPSLTVRKPDGTERVIPLDGPHEDVAVSRDGRTAYVTGGFTRDGYWDGLTVVDLTDGSTHRLAAGSRPLGIAVL
ncbi:YncE family protein [Streptomyces sp. NPDC090025]|uniref:YncE family protein n=1 Tax=Streptomyces sp. NPDC090025 TaxID=3365922 RepID=UPI0038393442